MTNRNNIETKPPITPEMKVGDFLKYYPELEDTLIAIAPMFAKLKNPVLRRTIAKVASLNQAAQVGNVSVGAMINKLRKAAGVDEMILSNAAGDGSDNSTPVWWEQEKVIKSIDARPMIDRGEHPLGIITKELVRMKPGTILELITPFYPAPLIDKAREQGAEVWSIEEDDGSVMNYFYKSTRKEDED
jgi:uncharacterized protein (DUF2249 family)